MCHIQYCVLLWISIIWGVKAGEHPPGPCSNNACIGQPRSCQDILQDNASAPSGVYTVCVDGRFPAVRVYCDMETDDGGWMVFQRRETGVTDFYRTWEPYAAGFGDPGAEFWLGNRIIHAITSCHGSCDLHIDLEDFDGESRHANYDDFYVAEESDKFRLHIGQYSGNAADGLAIHNNQPFSTHDQDNDAWPGSCAVSYHGAWWYEGCHDSNLNGKYLNGAGALFGISVTWEHWHGNSYSLKKSEMKIRCN